MATRRKSEAWKLREPERVADWDEERRETGRKFGLAHRDDPLDPLFNAYPFRWPDVFRWQHRDAVRELLRHYDKLEILAEIRRYEEAMAAEHARLAAMAAEYPDPAQLAEARTKVTPAVGWRPGLAPEHQLHFDVLVRIIVALRVWKEQGPDAGMQVLLGDKESAEFWRLGLMNNDAHEYGAEQKKNSTAFKHARDAERYLELALEFRDAEQVKGVSLLAHAVEYIRGIEEERLGCRPGKTYVWDRLAEQGMTAETYPIFRREVRRAAS